MRHMLFNTNKKFYSTTLLKISFCYYYSNYIIVIHRMRCHLQDEVSFTELLLSYLVPANAAPGHKVPRQQATTLQQRTCTGPDKTVVTQYDHTLPSGSVQRRSREMTGQSQLWTTAILTPEAA